MLTIGGESHGLMAGGSGFAKGGYVTAHAFGGEPEAVELTNRADLVAGVAVDGRMSTDQRKSILMLIDVVNGNLPTIGVVAEATLGAILAAMQIGVATLAFDGGVAEIEILMAIDALHFRVPATQRKLGSRMVEFEFGAQRLPVLSAVTLLAPILELVTVRAMKRAIERDVLTERNTSRGEAEAEYEKGPEIRQTMISCDGFLTRLTRRYVLGRTNNHSTQRLRRGLHIICQKLKLHKIRGIPAWLRIQMRNCYTGEKNNYPGCPIVAGERPCPAEMHI